jgi:hypothetical protein
MKQKIFLQKVLVLLAGKISEKNILFVAGRIKARPQIFSISNKFEV